MDRKEYLDTMEQQIRSRQAGRAARREMEDHIEEQKATFQAAGMTAEEAETAAVLDALRELAKGKVDPEAMARRRLEAGQQKVAAKSIRHKLEQQLEKARKTRLSAYKDKASGVLSEKEFAEISEDLRREEQLCQKRLEQLRLAEEQNGQEQKLEEKIREFLQFDHLEKAQLQQLVRRVTVDSQKHITITFTFVDPEKAD